MVIKQIKEYSNRLRINIVKSDGFNAGDTVIILSEQAHQQIQEEIHNLTDELNKANAKIQTLQEQQGNFNEMLEIVLNPIQETHKKQIEDKDNQITALTDKLNAMEQTFSQFKDRLNQLSLWDMALHKSHYDLINDFSNSIWIILKDDNNINSADVPAITTDDKQEQ